MHIKFYKVINMKEYKCNAPSSKKCLCNKNGYCHTLENCMYQYDTSHNDTIKKIVDLLYEFKNNSKMILNYNYVFIINQLHIGL